MNRPWIAMELESKWYIPYCIKEIFRRRVDRYFNWRARDVPPPRVPNYPYFGKKP